MEPRQRQRFFFSVVQKLQIQATGWRLPLNDLSAPACDFVQHTVGQQSLTYTCKSPAHLWPGFLPQLLHRTVDYL